MATPHLLDAAVGSGDHPLLADQGPAAEVEVAVALPERELLSAPHQTAPAPFPAPAPRRALTCRDTCQGQDPGTAGSPLTMRL